MSQLSPVMIGVGRFQGAQESGAPSVWDL